MAQVTSVLPLQAPTDVSVSQVEQELGKIWQSYGENAAARATTFNLMIYEPNSAAGDRLVPVDVIASQSPCRVLDLIAAPGADEGISAQVAAYCPIQKSRSTLVCGEYITLKGTNEAFNRLPALISELILPNMPVFLWWADSPLQDSAIFERLVNLSDRLIVDSSLFAHAERDLLQLKAMIDQGVQIADLNWRRLAPWQELSAQAFDPPDRRGAVWEIDGITIDYEKGNSSQALMFLGWLASRLGWQPEAINRKGGDYEICEYTFTGRDQNLIKAELAAIPTADSGSVKGDMLGLRLSSSKGNMDACNVFCSESTGCMRMEASGGAQNYRIHQVSPLADQGADTLLSQQLQRWGQEVLFEESLALTAQILSLA
ncbi:MAG: glucose-6-phosphate dehydrogenase assembly protein OpcA [Pseudanabaenaceae cyanobacterium bins.68]|nr:glucose-6-phosphate dehydrogenase assembly protein OpcA [Pseudanabaenaceae cyanobacterium bins.68]